MESADDVMVALLLKGEGDIQYKFVEKCHIWPNFTYLTKFSQFEKIQKTVRSTNLQSHEEVEESTNEKKEINGPALIDKLDDKSLIVIFSYLPFKQRLEIEEVCVRWRNVGRKSWHNIRKLEVYKSYRETFFGVYFNSEFIEKIVMRCAYLNTLRLHFVSSSEILPIIAKYCQDIITIKLAFTKYDIEHFNVLSKMKKLRSFSLTKIDRKFPINCLQSLPKTVQYIHIEAEVPTSKMYEKKPNVTNIFEEFNALHALKIRRLFFTKDTIEAISKKESIIKLDLAFSKIEDGLNSLRNLSNLKHLNLKGVESVDNNFLECLSTNCKKLNYLNVSYCTKLSDEGIEKLKNLDDLGVLLINMRWSPSNSISDLSLSQLRRLNRLECKNCLRIDDFGIKVILENNPNLRQLDVRLTSVTQKTIKLAIDASLMKKPIDYNHLFLFIDFHQKYINSPFLKINKKILTHKQEKKLSQSFLEIRDTSSSGYDETDISDDDAFDD